MINFFLNGTIKFIGETQVFGEFKKREFILETEEVFPQNIKFDFTNENVDVLDRYSVNEVVSISFVIKGTQFKDKHYTNLRAIAICERIDGRIEKEQAKAKKDNKRVQALLEASRKKNKTN